MVATLEYFESLLDPIWREQIQMVHPGKDIDQAIKEAYAHLIADEYRMKVVDSRGFKQLVNAWLSNKRPEKKKAPVKRYTLDDLK